GVARRRLRRRLDLRGRADRARSALARRRTGARPSGRRRRAGHARRLTPRKVLSPRAGRQSLGAEPFPQAYPYLYATWIRDGSATEPQRGDAGQRPTMSSGRTGTRVSSRPVAARSALTIAAVETT